MPLVLRFTPFGLITVAVAIRFTLIAFGWPLINSDEATMALMASHIAYHAEHPAFLYGQSYMGGLEAYLGAALFRLFGASTFALRLGGLFLYSLFLATIYLLARKLYDFKVALLALAFLAAGSQEMLYQQVQAVGRLETLAFGSASLLLAFVIADSTRSSPENNLHKRRLALYAAWGLVAGLGIWSDAEVIPFLFASAMLLLIFCIRSVSRRSMLFLLTGVLIGVSPLIAYDLTLPPQSSTFAVLNQIYRSGGTGRSNIHSSPGQGLAGAFLVTLPTMTGANAVCAVNATTAWPLSGSQASRTLRCTVLHGFWSAGIILLWMISTFASLRGLTIFKRRKLPSLVTRQPEQTALAGTREPNSPNTDPGPEDRDLRNGARLALLFAGALIFLLYAFSPAASQVPWYSRRYLTPLWVEAPAVVYPLAVLAQSRVGQFIAARRAAAYLVLATISTVLILGTANVFRGMSDFEWWNNQQYSLVGNLLRIHSSRIYSDYWTCNRIIFLSHERLMCSVLDNHLSAGENRYLAYADIVERARRPSYAFLSAAPENRILLDRLSRLRLKYRRFSFEGYLIYQLSDRLPGTAVAHLDQDQGHSPMHNHLSRHSWMEPAMELEGPCLQEDEAQTLLGLQELVQLPSFGTTGKRVCRIAAVLPSHF